MKRRFVMKFALSILIFCFLAGFAAAEIPTNPVETLGKIQEAIDNGDSVTFTDLVETDAILDSALSSFIRLAQDPEVASSLPPMLALLFSQLSSNNAQSIRQMLFAEARAFILNGISSGAFAGKKIDAANRQGLLAPLFASASIGRKAITNIGDPVKNGTDWLVLFTVHDFDNGNDYAIIGNFAAENGICRLRAIENLDQLILNIQRESQG